MRHCRLNCQPKKVLVLVLCRCRLEETSIGGDSIGHKMTCSEYLLQSEHPLLAETGGTDLKERQSRLQHGQLRRRRVALPLAARSQDIFHLLKRYRLTQEIAGTAI